MHLTPIRAGSRAAYSSPSGDLGTIDPSKDNCEPNTDLVYKYSLFPTRLRSNVLITFKHCLVFHRHSSNTDFSLFISCLHSSQHVIYCCFVPFLRIPSAVHHASKRKLTVRDFLHCSSPPEAIADYNCRAQTHQFSQSSTATMMPHACPYHTRVLMMGPNGHEKDLKPMDRFLAEGPAEQSALLIRSDTGRLSTNKGCTCGKKSGTT
jgi:hypothetical protein